MPTATLSDKGLSIFVFAAYHSLVSGQQVSQVVLDDRSGHHADSAGVKELEGAGFLRVENERGTFTEQGEAVLRQLIDAVRGAVS